jgi:ketosteroid isomerase-like protein
VTRIATIAITITSLVVFVAGSAAITAFGRENAQQSADVKRVKAANQTFVAVIAARDIRAMDQVWAHESYATFIGPLSTTVVIGWEGVRKAWQMRFGQFDRVTISSAEPHVRTNDKVAWVVGVEKVELLRED